MLSSRVVSQGVGTVCIHTNNNPDENKQKVAFMRGILEGKRDHEKWTGPLIV